MKRLTMTLALALMMAMPMMAERIAPETARKVAATFLTSNGAKTAQLADLTNSAGFENLYIFSTESSFVVMSADDCVKPILGYSLTGKFDADDIPDNVRWWLQGYSDQIADMMESRTQATAGIARQWKDLLKGDAVLVKTRDEVGPFIQTNWDQWYPYNYYCPSCSVYSANGGHALTGCVATAMAQVMKYHTTPVQGIGSHSYTHSTFGLQSVDFGTTAYDWANMPEQIYSNSSQTQIDAVATLIYHCGVAIDMNYGRTSSAAYSIAIAPALINYFNYSPSTHLVNRDENITDTEWIDLMRSELDALRPIIYGGQDHPTNATSGHSFVCDGYDADNYEDYYFHFNWGWSGRWNGYFSIDDMRPGGDGAGGGNHNYSYAQDAVIGIKPSACIAAAPTQLAYSVDGRDVTLTWDAMANAASYSVYRNSSLIGTSQSASYIDEVAPYGTNVYYVRSCDATGELSMSSDNVTVTLAFPAPTGLTAQMGENGVQLSWTAAEGALSYNVYCNDIRIGSQITATSFVDGRTIAGTLTYHVKGVDAFGDESVASNTATVVVNYKSPVVSDLSLAVTEGNAVLEWTSPEECYPGQPSATLYYGSGNGSNSYAWYPVYYGHRYPISIMTQHDGKKLYKVETKAVYAGTYTVYVYTDTQGGRPDPDALAATNTIVVGENNTGWREIVLSTPVTLSGDKDLWVVMKQEGTGKEYPVLSFNIGTYNADACYGSMSSPTNLSSLDSQYTLSWFIKTYLTDGTYTYNLYDGDTKVNGNTPITETTYTVASPANNAAHRYTVKTNYYGGVSGASNMAGLSLGTASLESLSLGDNDKMTVAENGILSVGALVNGNAANLVLEDSAQLIHSSIGVKATVMKSITPYTSNDNGWNFIASPVSESITPTAENGFFPDGSIYDLYYYQESTHYWRNYKANSFDLAYQQGYLYANSAATTLQFAGTLTPSNDAASVSGLSHSAEILNGFNLVGNPFACNATIDQDCYVIEGRQVVLASGTKVFAPCEGAVVKATSDAYTVTFSKYTGAKSDIKTNSLDLAITQGKTTLDRVRVRLGKGIGMERFNLNDGDDIRLSLWQNNQDFAVAYTDGQDEMLLNFKATENGRYSIGIEDNSLDLDYLHLIDNMTGEDIDLLATPCYTFEAKTTDYVSRFRLVFSSNDTSADSASDAPFAYVSHGEIIITADALAADAFDASIQVIDAMGRVIRVCTDVARNVSTQGMTSGVYVLRLIDGDHVRTQRIVIE